MPDHARTNALRSGRFSEQGRAYLVTTVTSGRRRFFERSGNAAVILDCLAWLEQDRRIRCISAVVMPDHVHVVLELGRTSLASVMHSLKSYTAKKVNALEGRSGPVWERQYHETALRDEAAVRDAIRYCLHNPIRARLATSPGEYPHSYYAYPIDAI